MSDEPRVWIRKRKTKGSKTAYDLRWVCPSTHKNKSRCAGTDYKLALQKAARLAGELDDGSYRHVKRIGWGEFVEDHVAKIEGTRNRREAHYILREFGEVVQPASPKHVTYSMIETYRAYLREKGNAATTIRKKLIYLRAGLNAAVKRRYAAVSEFDGALFPAVEKRPPRIVSDDEEGRLLEAADTLYGFIMRSFAFVALNTGGRRGELTGLDWEHVTLDGDEPEIHFAGTKSHRDRLIPLTPELVSILLKLKAQTLVEGGPFRGFVYTLDHMWQQLRKRAGAVDVTIHDLRRSYVARLIRAGVPLPTVQELAGHSDIKTTVTYYNWVSKGDKRAAMEKLRRAAGG